jgi:D-psicose/D-tagatose/L-ribulose 3-epimerase
MDVKLCVFASTPDMDELEFLIRPLTGKLRELGETVVGWGYDGFELMPNPEDVVAADEVRAALDATGAIVPVVNTGRMQPQGLALLHRDPVRRRRSIDAYKRMTDLAGEIGARVGLGIARGLPDVTVRAEEADELMAEVFAELAEHAEGAGAVIMLEPADPGALATVTTVVEAVRWVDRIASASFSLMLDTYQLVAAEESIESGVRAARRLATHIHLYDPGRWPPGVRPGADHLDWPHVAAVLASEGFAGTGSVVLAPEGDREAAARASAGYLRELFARAPHPAAAR